VCISSWWSMCFSRMLKKSASSVLASFRPSTYPRGYACGPSLAAALLDGLFEHPAGTPWYTREPSETGGTGETSKEVLSSGF
jgi:hypothetical protein